jgi:hypothetical protein
MHSLANIQEKILECFLTYKDTAFSDFKQQGKINSAERFDVHRQTIFENLVNSLRITFPSIWRLIGNECAKGVSLAYIHQISNLPSLCITDEFGKNFPAFLAVFESTKNLKYLPDFAELEWLRSRSYNSKTSLEVNPNIITQIPPDLIESIHLKFNSSVFFFQSEFPLEKIQELLDDPTSEPITLTDSISYAMVCRVDGEIITLWLPKQIWLFLNLINKGENLGAALDDFLQYGEEKEVKYLFQLMMQYKLISNIENPSNI